MVSLTSLVLPILLSAVLVFVASSIIHMVLKYHRNDFAPLPNEEAVRAALRAPPGEYLVPWANSMEAMKSPEYVQKMTQGPVALITVRPNGPPAIGSSMGQWFVYSLVVGIIAAYIAGRALGPGADYLQVFRFVGTTAFTAYVVALWQRVIWWGARVSTTLKSTFDGLIYALLTAGVFGWLWPGS